jgi:tetratricopeptide (TPR) repeat protein
LTLRYLALGLALGISTGCSGGAAVIRIIDGRPQAGRAVDEEAYAASLRAGIFDASGDRDRALEELESALAADPDSPELLARYGEVACGAERSSPPRPATALSAFSRALTLDPTYAPAWLGRARCLELLGREPEALAAGELAAAYDPEDVGTTELVARLLFAFGRKDDAWAWLDGLAALTPDSPEAQRALLVAAARQHDAAREALARRRLQALGVRLPGDQRAALERAIAERDLAGARRAAVALRLPSGALAVLLAHRAPELALAEGEAVLAADPSASDAWLAALAAADALGDAPTFARLLPRLDPEPLPPSDAALTLLAELVARHAGDDATRGLAGALAAARPAGDSKAARLPAATKPAREGKP